MKLSPRGLTSFSHSQQGLSKDQANTKVGRAAARRAIGYALLALRAMFLDKQVFAQNRNFFPKKENQKILEETFFFNNSLKKEICTRHYQQKI